MAKAEDHQRVACFKRKAIWALLPHAIRLSGGGQQQMIGAFSRAFRPSIFMQNFVWGHVGPFVARLFSEPRTHSLDRAITIVSPHFHSFDQNTFARWSTATLATLAVPYTEEVGQSVADTLWQIMVNDALRQHIPIGIWLWSSKQTLIPPVWPWRRGRDPRGWEATRQFRALGDIEILKSYLLFVWLEWEGLEAYDLAAMRTSIREDFNGIGMGQHREDLRKRLDHVLGQLDRGPEYLERKRPDLLFADTEIAKNQYRELKQVLLEVDEEILTRTPSRLIILFGILTSVDTSRISLDIHV